MCINVIGYDRKIDKLTCVYEREKKMCDGIFVLFSSGKIDHLYKFM